MKYSNISLKVFFNCILMTIFLSCNEQNTKKNVCETKYTEAKKKFNKFYVDKNTALVLDALKDIQKSLDCPETRNASVELKISALSILKEYDKGYQFIDSLEEKDFSKSYKKKMQYNFLKALSYESKSNISDRNIYYNKAISEAQAFIDSKKTIDEEAYYDLFFVKSKILNTKEINSEIDSLKMKYPSDKDFFESLKDSFNETSKEVNAH